MLCPGTGAPPDNIASIATVPLRKRTMAESGAGSLPDKMCKFAKIQGLAVDER
jgi:hypothetical protein